MGASREMMQMMAYEPLTLLIAVGFYLATGSFLVSEIITSPISPALFMPGMLLGFLFITAIKLRKSPFDLSTSHHAHQEMVKGLTTEMAGPTLAIMEIAEYYEKILLLGIVGLFIVNPQPCKLACCRGCVPALLFPGNPLGQYERPGKMEDHAGKLLDCDPPRRGPEPADFNAYQIGTVQDGPSNGRIHMTKLAKSPWLLHYDGSSCNGCDIEVLACTMPAYDIERFGIINTGDPFQADILLITGGINSQSEKVVKQIYSQMPQPQGGGGCGNLRLHRRRI